MDLLFALFISIASAKVITFCFDMAKDFFKPEA
jgi:hypothetical protein